MRIIQSEFFRAVCMIVIGALVVRYRQQTLTGITVAIGILFFLSGLVSCISYVTRRRRLQNAAVAEGDVVAAVEPSSASCVVGVGCLLFGIVLALMPDTFLSFIEQILALLLIIGAIGQMASLVSINRQAKVHWAYWIMPILILLVGVVAIAKPLELLSSPLFVIGWCMMLYGVVEMLYTLKIYLLRRQIAKQQVVGEAEYEDVSTDGDAPTA